MKLHFILNLHKDSERAKEKIFEALLLLSQRYSDLSFSVNSDEFYVIHLEIQNLAAGSNPVELFNALVPEGLFATRAFADAFSRQPSISFTSELIEKISGMPIRDDQQRRFQHLQMAYIQASNQEIRSEWQNKLVNGLRCKINQERERQRSQRGFFNRNDFDDEPAHQRSFHAAALASTFNSPIGFGSNPAPSAFSQFSSPAFHAERNFPELNLQQLIEELKREIEAGRYEFDFESLFDQRQQYSSSLRARKNALEKKLIEFYLDLDQPQREESASLEEEKEKPRIPIEFLETVDSDAGSFVSFKIIVTQTMLNKLRGAVSAVDWGQLVSCSDVEDLIARSILWKDINTFLEQIKKCPEIIFGVIETRFPSSRFVHSGFPIEIKMQVRNFNLEGFLNCIEEAKKILGFQEEYTFSQITLINLQARVTLNLGLAPGDTIDEEKRDEYVNVLTTKLMQFEIYRKYCSNFKVIKSKNNFDLHLVLVGISVRNEESLECLFKFIRRYLRRDCDVVDYPNVSISAKSGLGVSFDHQKFLIERLERQKELLRLGISDDKVPQRYRCSLTGKIMDEPCFIRFAPDRYYDRKALEVYLFSQKEFICPVTNNPVNLSRDIILDTDYGKKVECWFNVTINPANYDNLFLTIANLTKPQLSYFLALSQVLGLGRQVNLVRVLERQVSGVTQYTAQLNLFWLDNQLSREAREELAQNSGVRSIIQYGAH